MKFLITGAHGFVATNLAAAIVGSGNKVIGIVRGWKPELPGYGHIWDQITFERGTITDQAFLDRVFLQYQPDVVFHLAAQTEVGRSVRDPGETFNTNVLGTFCMLEAARKAGVGAFVFASSDKAYGQKSQDEMPYIETMKLADDGDWYSCSKAMADFACQQYARLHGLPIRILRPCNIYGPGQRNTTTLITSTIDRLIKGNPAAVRKGRESVVREYIYVRDVVEAYMSVADDALINPHDRGEAYNIASGNRLTTWAMVQTIMRCFGVDKDFVEIEPAPENVVEVGDQFMNDDKFRKKFPALRSTPLDDGIKDTINWQKRLT